MTDATGHPIAGADVHLMGNSENLSAQTDSDGKYSLSFSDPGTYRGRAEAAGYEPASLGPFTFAKNQSRTFDITLRAKASEQDRSSKTPEFFDEPKFTIAGVTDTSNLGGHASGMTGPNESLAKDVVATAPTLNTPNPNSAGEQAARDLADHNTSDFRANYSAGKLLLEDGKPRDALPYLARASSLNADNYESSFALATAYADASEYPQARTLIGKMLAQKQNAGLHHLLATVEEKSGDPVEAERQFQQAAKLDSSESNLFDWGMELLTHHATEPAIEVFRHGNARFPQSARMLSGLAAAFYERGAYDEALQQVCAASDATPRHNSVCFLVP